MYLWDATMWSHHWADPATREASETLGTFIVHWDPPRLDEIETDAGFSLDDVTQALGRLKFSALGRLKHDDGPPWRPPV